MNGYEEFFPVWEPRRSHAPFEECVAKVDGEFSEWLSRTLDVPAEYAEAREKAAYVNWSCVVAPRWQLARPTMFMSKRIMTHVWSWDNQFNAMATFRADPVLAWDQMMCFFDHQDASGIVADVMDDALCQWSFTKPPIYGWVLGWMMDRSEFVDEARMREIYEPLCRLTEWWFAYRDFNGNGIPQYMHGNDCGWDNCTAFDLEVYNELTFGTKFLYVNEYYEGKPYSYKDEDIWANLVRATAEYVDANAEAFSGVRINDGFSNTIPWTVSSGEPARIGAISKHPYVGPKEFPKDEQHGTRLNGLCEPDEYVPAYSTSSFPEYYATAIQTETMVRDMGPIPNDIYGTPHGRHARPGNPCGVLITEAGFAPNENRVEDHAMALAIKAKTTARYYTFFLNKGVERVYIFGALEKDMWLGVVLDRFSEYAKTTGAVYPADDGPYVSPALGVLSRIVAKMAEEIDPDLTETRELTVGSISDTHDNYQFAGDGTPAHPNLYDREVFAFLPFQANATRFVVPYYVMTRNVVADLPPEEFTVGILGVKGEGASVTVCDPIGDTEVPVTVNSAGEEAEEPRAGPTPAAAERRSGMLLVMIGAAILIVGVAIGILTSSARRSRGGRGRRR